MNQNMAVVATSVASLESCLKRLRSEPRNSGQVAKKQKTSNEDDSDVSLHSDSTELRAIMAPKETTSKSTDESSDLLSQIASNFNDKEGTSRAVTDKLGEIVNKCFSSPVSEEKLKEKLGQYLRPDNCAKLTVPKVNPEIRMKLNSPATRQDLQIAGIQRATVKADTALTQLAEIMLTKNSDSKGPDTGNMLTLNTDALALLGHSTHQLSMHGRQAIKPYLNKECATLCSPQGPVKEFLFGDELQSQLNNIKATNKIGNAMASDFPKHSTKGKETWKNKSKSSFWGCEGAGRTAPPPYYCPGTAPQTEAVAKDQVLTKRPTIQVQDFVSFVPALLII